MKQMLATAERLHAVEDAFGKFIMLWAVDEIIDEVAGVDRIYGDIKQANEKFSVCEQSLSHYRAGFDD